MKKSLAGILLAVALSACAARGSYVSVDKVALGRVVIYRNGVAFYERRATVTDGTLTVRVPRERVDDFLKSLTVVDASTNQPLAVAIPRDRTEDGSSLVMTMQLPTKATAKVVLTYVTEAPAWKPSYRVVVGDKGKVMLEGWAIVDNTSGEDWKGVMVGVGASSALSFKYDLWSVRQVQRATLQSEEKFAVAPPSGMSPYQQGTTIDAGATGEQLLTDIGDDEIRRPAGHPNPSVAIPISGTTEVVSSIQAAPPPMPSAHGGGYRFEKKAAGNDDADEDGDDDSTADVASSKSSAHHTRPHKERKVVDTRVATGDAKMKSIAPSIVHSNKTIVIESFADANGPQANEIADDRANLVRNQLIDEGVPPARIKIVKKLEANASAHVRLVAEAGPAEQQQGQNGAKADDTDAEPVGESHFASSQPMTVAKDSSAMVSMVRGETDGEVVYLYDAESERGNAHFAFRAVRFRNPTDSTLETGPVTVYGNERFIGEGLTEPIAPKSSAVVPFALDRQVLIERQDSEEDKIAKLVTLERGVLTAEVQHIRRQTLNVTNRLPQPARVYIRHTINKGWTLVDAPPKFERVGDAHLFEVDLQPGEAKSVRIEEATPMQRTLDLNANASLEMMKLYVDAPEASVELRDQLKKLLGFHKSLVDLGEQQTSLRRRLSDYRERMDELHGQIVTLQAVKTGGDLMSHLKDKMRDISDRVQKATIAVVDTEEKAMLLRVQFQDALAELSLDDVTKPTSVPPTGAAATPAMSKK